MEITKFIGKRLFYAVVALLLLITITFLLMHMLPGDPFIGAKPIPESAKQALYVKYGLNQPLYMQYIRYVGNAVRGDFGNSTVYQGQTVGSIIMQAFPYSFELGMLALIFAVILGIFMGVVAALHNGKPLDTVTMAIAAVGISVPSFILGALLQYYLGIKLSGWTNATFGFRMFEVSGWSTFSQKLIPSFVLGFGQLAVISRLMRASTLDVIGQDYIKTAKSKGLSELSIVWHHTLRNASLPVITVLGPLSASILTGAFVVENIFNIPGMGKYFVTSVQANDYPMICGTTLFYGSFLILANLIVDILYMVIDPNIKLGKAKV